MKSLKNKPDKTTQKTLPTTRTYANERTNEYIQSHIPDLVLGFYSYQNLTCILPSSLYS